MVEIVESKEILKNSINLIWKATGEKVVTITFNNYLRLATISLNNKTNITVNLERIADNKNVQKCQLCNNSISDNSKHDQDIDKLINFIRRKKTKSIEASNSLDSASEGSNSASDSLDSASEDLNSASEA
ncbi:23183_t:CDS:2 [Cetraspora pellucida]|uniref:23183_t:CDS:1 n=1 Tax=Cetraspora pellucida TaxID=1433469 RepID=A0A9N9EU67_9GLOM|nr:23183_t:CDS:2 [Cetraspora pellucida]